MYFQNYRLSKTGLDFFLKNAGWEHPSTVNMLKGSKRLWNLHETTFIIFFPSFWKQMILKICPLLEFEILGLFVNTLSSDYKYPFPDWENLPFIIQRQFS